MAKHRRSRAEEGRRLGDQIRWVPATKPGRLTSAFALLGWDGVSMSDDDSDVIFEVPSA